jgi:hypothetical protein
LPLCRGPAKQEQGKRKGGRNLCAFKSRFLELDNRKVWGRGWAGIGEAITCYVERINILSRKHLLEQTSPNPCLFLKANWPLFILHFDGFELLMSERDAKCCNCAALCGPPLEQYLIKS